MWPRNRRIEKIYGNASQVKRVNFSERFTLIIHTLEKANKIHPPKWLVDNVQYLTVVGSEAYGVARDESDHDIYGFAIPLKEEIFPHLKGEIQGFGRHSQRFEQWQEHHVLHNNNQYDFAVFSIVKYFQLCMENNPNMIDSLFTSQNCVVYITQIGQMVRENRRIFLHKKAWFKFKGYAYSQIHKMKSKSCEGTRKEMVEKYGYDVKFAYHTVRLLNEIEQILVEGDLDLQRNSEQLKAIRRGEWIEQQVVDYFDNKEKQLEYLYVKSTLPAEPSEQQIKTLLLQCLEQHYGSLDKAIVATDKHSDALRQISDICRKLGM